jgi:hypothetical protein
MESITCPAGLLLWCGLGIQETFSGSETPAWKSRTRDVIKRFIIFSLSS